MAGESSRAIEVIDASALWQIRGGVDKQTRAAQLAIDQATSAVKDVATSVAPRDTGLSDVMMQVLSNRRPGPGPSSAPALPPTTTLTR